MLLARKEGICEHLHKARCWAGLLLPSLHWAQIVVIFSLELSNIAASRTTWMELNMTWSMKSQILRKMMAARTARVWTMRIKLIMMTWKWMLQMRAALNAAVDFLTMVRRVTKAVTRLTKWDKTGVKTIVLHVPLSSSSPHLSLILFPLLILLFILFFLFVRLSLHVSSLNPRFLLPRLLFLHHLLLLHRHVPLHRQNLQFLSFLHLPSTLTKAVSVKSFFSLPFSKLDLILDRATQSQHHLLLHLHLLSLPSPSSLILPISIFFPIQLSLGSSSLRHSISVALLLWQRIAHLLWLYVKLVLFHVHRSPSQFVSVQPVIVLCAVSCIVSAHVLGQPAPCTIQCALQSGASRNEQELKQRQRGGGRNMHSS